MNYYKTFSILVLVAFSATACLQSTKKDGPVNYDAPLTDTVL